MLLHGRLPSGFFLLQIQISRPFVLALAKFNHGVPLLLERLRGPRLVAVRRRCVPEAVGSRLNHFSWVLPAFMSPLALCESPLLQSCHTGVQPRSGSAVGIQAWPNIRNARGVRNQAAAHPLCRLWPCFRVGWEAPWCESPTLLTCFTNVFAALRSSSVLRFLFSSALPFLSSSAPCLLRVGLRAP